MTQLGARPTLRHIPSEPSPHDRYDPWRDLRENWPEVIVRVQRLPGRLLGELCYPVISLNAASGPAQQRTTLSHEIVHLERGVRDCGPWLGREEL